jgi:hypothetical protein
MYVSCMIFNSLIFCLCKNYFINFYIIKIFLLYILIILFYIYVIHFNDLVKLYFNNLFIQIFNYFKKICKNKRKSIMTFYYIILYFIFSYFYNILDNVLFPATTGYFLNNSNLEYFNSIFGNYSIVALVVVFVILLYILTILYFIKLIILINIFLERLLILFFSDFFFKKYSKYLLKIYFCKSLKIFFYDFKIHKYKVIRKIFNPKFLFKIKYNIYINFIELKLYLIKNYKKDIIFFFIFMFVLILIFLNL